MESDSLAPGAAAYPLVQVSADPPGQYTAQVVGLPEIRATGANRQEALRQVRERLAQRLISGQLVSLEIPAENTLTELCGWAKDDPEYELFLQALRQARQAADERADLDLDLPACSDSSSTPTT